ncbi:MAG: lipopolysaccharide biosynthesis protein [Phascolarctobacterium sp.]|nr:lipopolysaccharide biosynthesis protein [Phascolarctobacterium sp.]
MKAALLWKLLERFSVQGSQFIIQVFLARLLSPEHYGALAIMMIVVNLANVVIQNGFNTALIQNKDANDEDFSSVFWLVLGISCYVYVGLWYIAPHMASFYNMAYLVNPFRVICLMMIPGALNSVQLAIIRKNMDFKKEFTSNLVSIVISGFIGITCAYIGLGLWALVVQTLLNTTISCFTMWKVVGWRPSFIFNSNRVKVLFSYGYKLVLAGVIDTLYGNLSAFVIGAKYSSASLGYYARGNQFPAALMGAINSAVQSVMLPALSIIQDNKKEFKLLMRKSITLSCYVVFLLMAILAGIAKPMVSLVLTDKWLPCVPYIQIFCFTYAFWPVHTNNLQAINALGRSDIFLKLEVIKKVIGLSALAFAVYYYDDPISIAGMGIVTAITSSFINCYPNKYLLDYSYFEQMKDLLPYSILALTTCLIELLIVTYIDNSIIAMVLAIIGGTLFYVFVSSLSKLEAYMFIYEKIIALIRGK